MRGRHRPRARASRIASSRPLGSQCSSRPFSALPRRAAIDADLEPLTRPDFRELGREATHAVADLRWMVKSGPYCKDEGHSDSSAGWKVHRERRQRRRRAAGAGSAMGSSVDGLRSMVGRGVRSGGRRGCLCAWRTSEAAVGRCAAKDEGEAAVAAAALAVGGQRPWLAMASVGTGTGGGKANGLRCCFPPRKRSHLSQSPPPVCPCPPGHTRQ
ncbi:hypothetical protein MC885_013660, partial [Smutsia gigantea]